MARETRKARAAGSYLANSLTIEARVKEYESQTIREDTMVIVKPIYEPLPVAYLLIAIGVVFWIDNSLALISGALFYCAGAMIWVRRSVFRRDQRIKAKKGHSHIRTRATHSSFNLPESVYELLPFAYIATGFMIFYIQPDRLGLVLTGLCCFAGCLILALRSTNRHRR